MVLLKPSQLPIIVSDQSIYAIRQVGSVALAWNLLWVQVRHNVWRLAYWDGSTEVHWNSTRGQLLDRSPGACRDRISWNGRLLGHDRCTRYEVCTSFRRQPTWSTQKRQINNPKRCLALKLSGIITNYESPVSFLVYGAVNGIGDPLVDPIIQGSQLLPVMSVIGWADTILLC